MRYTGYAARMGEVRNANILTGKPERKRPLVRPRLRWNDIKLDLKGAGCEGMD
jgi:hypothetical protein